MPDAPPEREGRSRADAVGRGEPCARRRRDAILALGLTILFGSLALLHGRSLSAADERASLLVVANDASEVSRLDSREVRKLFLGKSRRLPDGSRAVLASHDPSTSRFNAQALGRSDAQVTAAWSRLKFSGRVRPPRRFDSVEAIVAFVASTPNAIAYLPAGVSASVGEGVRTVHVVAP